jgi:hypothetical protein
MVPMGEREASEKKGPNRDQVLKGVPKKYTVGQKVSTGKRFDYGLINRHESEKGSHLEKGPKKGAKATSVRNRVS